MLQEWGGLGWQPARCGMGPMCALVHGQVIRLHPPLL